MSGIPPARKAEGGTLFRRTLLSFLAALAVLLTLLAGAVGLAVTWSARDWTAARSEETGRLLRSLVIATYRSRGRLEQGAIAGATLPYLDESTYLLVYAPDGSLVFGWRRGELLEPHSASNPGAGRAFLSRHSDEVKVQELRDRGAAIGGVAAGVLSFSTDSANRRFLGTLAVVGGVGAAASFLLAVIVAFLFSSRLSSQATGLAAGLVRLASGERGVSFDTGGARELAQIGASARTLQDRLAEEERLRGQWAADVAHDLRTPLAALRSQLEAMGDGVLPVTPERLARARAELLRAQALVEDLGELSRIESPGMKPRLAKIGAEDLLEELCGRFALEAERRGIALDCRADSGLTLTADEHLLVRATGNVLQNALQHAGDGGRVSLSISADGEAVALHPGAVIRTENTGSLPEEQIPRVFDRMYRGEGARHTPGSGLGLTIAKAIVELHGGSISIANSGRGTVVVEMRLPA